MYVREGGREGGKDERISFCCRGGLCPDGSKAGKEGGREGGREGFS